jgi:hypothetical protein
MLGPLPWAQSDGTLTDRHFRRADGAPPRNPPSCTVTSAAQAAAGRIHFCELIDSGGD